MITAIVQTQHDETTVIEMPCEADLLGSQLWTSDILIQPESMRVCYDNGDGITVTLEAEDRIGEQLIPLFSPRHSLKDVNRVVNAVANARPEVRTEMEARILSGQYSTPDEVIRDVRLVTEEAAPVKLSFYCPLKGQVNESDSPIDYIDNSTLLANQEKIAVLLEEEQQPDDGDMVEYLVGNNSALYDKLYLAEFRVEEIGGRLYGRIDCWFTQQPDEDEIDYLREEIIGQAADGFGEHFEQRPICIDEGELYVSFWDCSDDYFMYTDDEMEGYLNGSMTVGDLR